MEEMFTMETPAPTAYNNPGNENGDDIHIEIDSEECGLKNNSVVLAEQIRTIDKSRLKEKIGHIEDEKIINKINNALGVSFGLEE